MAARRSLVNFIVKRLKSDEAGNAARYVSPTSSLGDMNHRVTKLESYMLVWNGHYRHLSEVPTHVSRDAMERARNHFRIRLNIGIFAATILASFIMVISGKNAHNRGETVQKQNLSWHQAYNKEHEADGKPQH